jgi:hypothetical protein
MIRWFLALCLLFATPALAAPVLVKSGEHDGFTRLVMDFGHPIAWQLGRTEDGYELRIADQSPGYDLTEAFKLIGKSRLAAIWADPNSGDLRLGIACACHAIPFEFRPGIVVIDLSDGPPPKGSSFELSLGGSSTGILSAHPVPKPKQRPQQLTDGLDWTQQALADLNKQQPNAGSAMVLPATDPALQPMREGLMRDLSAGAANGLVDMALPEAVAKPQMAEAPVPGMAVTLGDLPGVAAGQGLPDHAGLGAQGQSCTSAEALDMASWVTDAPVSAQMAEARDGLVGEFDAVDPTALRHAVTFDLAIGFGAEARQLLQGFPADLPERPVWISLSYLVDGEIPPISAFAGQAACDTPAALWAILSEPQLTQGDAINRNSAYQAFSDLPLDLRRQLGPAVVDRFMALGDADTAAKIRNAVLRAPGQAGPTVTLMQARMELAANDPTTAEAQLNSLIADSGPETGAALVALADLRTGQDLPVTADIVTALQAVVQETAGQPDAAAARRSLIWAEAAAGDFRAAFTDLRDDPEAGARLWRLLALIGPDDAVLDYAVLAVDAPLPQSDAETNAAFAQRLQDLGLPDAALRWAAAANPPDPLLLARIHLSRHDGRAALAALDTVDGPDAYDLRAKALLQLGDPAAAATVLAAADRPEDELLALTGARDWQDVAERGQGPWKELAALLPTPPAANGEGPLARAQRLADASTATQEQVVALLAAVANQ